MAFQIPTNSKGLRERNGRFCRPIHNLITSIQKRPRQNNRFLGFFLHFTTLQIHEKEIRQDFVCFSQFW